MITDDDRPLPFSPMALDVHRATGDVVGRSAELQSIAQELATAGAGRLVGLTVEGEPGIGKTRLLVAAAERATADGFTAIAVTADEELRGPFLVARSILGSPEAARAAHDPQTAEAIARCLDSMSGQDDPGLATLAPDSRLLRTFDLGAVAFRALAAERPLAILIDDLQWSDEDSLRLLRYVVRTDGASPIFLMFAIRPEEFAVVNEAVNLVADMGRMGVVRRLKLERFSQTATREFLAQVLGGPVDPSGAAVMHAQAEGVPFIVEEMAFTYRENGMIQEIDGVWTLAGNAERLVPSAVKTLISRRATKLPEPTKALLAVAAILGRRFSLKDLREVQLRVDGSAPDAEELAETLAPAVTAGLLIEHEEGSAADYSFQHEQVREFAAATLTSAARRAVHAAIVALLMSGEPSAASLPLIARHAKSAGDGAVCVRFSVEASRNALAANAPEEVLRVVELALPSASTPEQRVGLLDARDRALDMLRRPRDRMQGLAELAALAEALGDTRLGIDVRLRRAAAMRTAEEHERAAELAREVRDLAVEQGDREGELAACMELGQDLMHATAGESFTPAAKEVDLDACDEAFRRAMELAHELGDVAAEAAATRELGVVQLGRVRAWFIEQLELGLHLPLVQRVAAGEVLEDIMPELPIAPLFMETFGLLHHALELFEQLGDRRGAMSTIIALAYLNWGADIHFGASAARHIEEIRRLTSRMKAFTNESEREAFEAQMLYGSHVFGAREGDPRPGAREGPGGPPVRQGDRRSEPRVPGGRRDRDGRPRPRRRRGREIVDRPRRRGRHRASEPAPRATAGDLAGDRGCRGGRCRGDARTPGARRAAGDRLGSARRAVRGARAPGGRVLTGGGAAGRRRPHGAGRPVGGRGIGSVPDALRPLPLGRPGRRGPGERCARPRARRGSDDVRARRVRRAPGRDARGPEPRRPAAGRAGPDGNRCARMGGGRAPVRPVFPRDDRAAHDRRGRAGPVAPGTARQRDGRARRADRRDRIVRRR